MKIDTDTVLLVIDVQRGFDDRSWGPRNNPEAERNIALLIATWRRAGLPVFHVHHDSTMPTSALVPGGPGNEPKPEAIPLYGEPVYRKSVNSAFIGTSLEAELRIRGVTRLVIVGLTTNHCVSTTTRTAANLGFETFVVADATAAFDRLHLDGTSRLADDVHRAALSDLSDEFATVVRTRTVVNAASAAAMDWRGVGELAFAGP